MDYDLLIVKHDVNWDMFEQIKKVVVPKNNKLIMIVKTPGGDPMLAYRTMVLLRSFYQKIYFIVFDEAMSAGTLMALGSDEIILENGACLGPLDLQIRHPRDDSTISTLDVRDTASSTVFDASNVMLKICAKNLKEGLPMTVAVDSAIKIVSDLYKPIMDKIDPFHLHESYRNAELSTNYGTRLLMSGMIKEEGEATAISVHLANDYSDHGYAIIKEEAEKIGLKMATMEKILGNNTDMVISIKEIYAKIRYNNVFFHSVNDEAEKNTKQKGKQ